MCSIMIFSMCITPPWMIKVQFSYYHTFYAAVKHNDNHCASHFHIMIFQVRKKFTGIARSVVPISSVLDRRSVISRGKRKGKGYLLNSRNVGIQFSVTLYSRNERREWCGNAGIITRNEGLFHCENKKQTGHKSVEIQKERQGIRPWEAGS